MCNVVNNVQSLLCKISRVAWNISTELMYLKLLLHGLTWDSLSIWANMLIFWRWM